MAGQTHATEGERGATEGAATRELALIGIGAGDPDWITLEAVKAIRSLDVLFVVVKERGVRRARPVPARAGGRPPDA